MNRQPITHEELADAFELASQRMITSLHNGNHDIVGISQGFSAAAERLREYMPAEPPQVLVSEERLFLSPRIHWLGGKCPVADHVQGVVFFRDGTAQRAPLCGWNWEHGTVPNPGKEIVAYCAEREWRFYVEEGRFYILGSGERIGPMKRFTEGISGDWFMFESDPLQRLWEGHGVRGMRKGLEDDIWCEASGHEPTPTPDKVVLALPTKQALLLYRLLAEHTHAGDEMQDLHNQLATGLCGLAPQKGETQPFDWNMHPVHGKWPVIRVE